MLEKTLRMNDLFDFYHVLLTERQREYMEMYYFEDYSLVEIAEQKNVSRQAVYDNIKRTEKILESYEEQLRLYEKHEKRMHLLDTCEKLLMVNDKNNTQLLELIRQLKEIG